MSDDSRDDEYTEAGNAVYAELLERLGEASPQPRLWATRRAVELLGDPQRAYPIVHVTGTNGKTSTSRIAESILRAYGLRTGLFTSPHLTRFNERIVVDGAPISDEALARNWEDIKPYLAMADAECAERGEPALTFFEAMTVLAFACFADAPVDVAVIEVGMGGEWDSTNVADGQVAVITPISLDHTNRLGSTITAIAKTKSGIIKPAASVVSAAQTSEALVELQTAAELTESTLAVEGEDFEVVSTAVAVGGQLLTVRGRAATYEDLFLPLYGDHQAQNAAVAIAAVESFLGGGSRPLERGIVEEGLATATSPGRLQLVGVEPTVLVDGAHNPAGAQTLASAIGTYFDFSGLAVVLGVLADKDAVGIIKALDPIASVYLVTQSSSDRAIPAGRLSALIAATTGRSDIEVYEDPIDALEAARAWADEADGRGVLVTGSITLIGEAIEIADDRGWKEK
jgi:dihydrofolate synthase/folylpolyglutamate synthase